MIFLKFNFVTQNSCSCALVTRDLSSQEIYNISKLFLCFDSKTDFTYNNFNF